MSNAHDIAMLALMVALILIGAAMGMDVGDE
jgi:hypothetical protein